MVEYVLGGSPTNKESPLSALEPRLRSLKFEDNDKVVSIITTPLCDHSSLFAVSSYYYVVTVRNSRLTRFVCTTIHNQTCHHESKKEKKKQNAPNLCKYQRGLCSILYLFSPCCPRSWHFVGQNTHHNILNTYTEIGECEEGLFRVVLSNQK